MTSKLSFREFSQTIEDLRAWDPDKQYISKNLTLKAKPRRDTFCQKFKAFFKGSKSNEALKAAKVIHAYTNLFQNELTNDADALMNLKDLTINMHNTLVLEKTPGHRKFRSKKKRAALDKTCQKIRVQYKAYQKNAPLPGFAKSVHNSNSSYTGVSYHPIPPRLPSKNTSLSETSISITPQSTIKLAAPDTQAKPIAPAVPVSSAKSTAPAPSVTSSTKIKKPPVTFNVPKIRSGDDLRKFITKIKPTSVEEATAIFAALDIELKKGLDSEKTAFKKIGYKNKEFVSGILSRKIANELLIRMNEIKADFVTKKKDIQLFKQAHLSLSITIREQFFADRIQKASEQLEAIQRNMTNNGGALGDIVDEWEIKLTKFKPIAIPKYFHCTKVQYVNTIIMHPSGIQGQPMGVRSGYEGAFASSVPEMGAIGAYGDYCFALSDHIEAKVKQNFPIVTNVSNVGYGGTSEPIYVGKAPVEPKTTHSSQPRIWLGFKQDLILRRPDKSTDPIGYYEETTFSLFATMAANDYDFDKVDPATSQLALKKRKIRLLFKGDFDEVVSTIQKALHFTLPADWGKEVKCPNDCALVTRKTGGYGVTPLKDMVGVQYNP